MDTNSKKMLPLYSKMKVLVVDDFNNFVRVLVSMLRDMGFMVVDEADNANDALKRITGKEYDIVLCDYHLGEGRNGQQILEEARVKGILPITTAFIIVSAENSTSITLSASDFRADDFLMKPITREILSAKIEKVVLRKLDMANVEKALQAHDLPGALKFCDDGMARATPHKFEFLKLKGEILLETGDYESAARMYRQIIEARPLPWAMIGYGRAIYLSNRINQAMAIFREATEQNRSEAEAYDWLAKIYDQLAQYREAEDILLQATKLAPRILKRERMLGEVALKNNDMEVARKAFENAVTYGRHSILKDVRDYDGLAKVLVETGKPADALRVVKEARSDFRGNPHIQVKAQLMEGVIYKKIGKLEESKKIISEATKLFAKNEREISSDTALELAELCIEFGDKAGASAALLHVVKNNHEDIHILQKAQSMYDRMGMHEDGVKKIESAVQEVVTINDEGVKIARAGRFLESAEFFEKAAEALPDNKVVNANAAGAFVMHLKQDPSCDNSLGRARHYLERLRELDPYDTKYLDLMTAFNRISVKKH